MGKRIISSILITILAVLLVSGCGGNTGGPEPTTQAATEAQSTAAQSTAEVIAPDYGDTGGIALPIAEERITVRALMNMAMSTPLVDTLFIREVEKRTNIQLVFENIQPTEPLEKYNLLIASNNLPDICGSLDDTITQLGLENFVPINNYFDVMPNFKKAVESKPEIMKVCSAQDGNLYTLPYTMYLQEPTFNYGMLYRKDIFDKLGISVPKGPDGYYDALKKLKQAYPKADLFVNYYGTGALGNLSESWNTFNDFYQPDGKDEYIYGPITNEWKEFLAYYGKLYAEELIDPEFFTTSYEQFSAKALQPENGFIFRAWFGTADSMSNQVKDTVQGYDLRAAYPVGAYGKNFKEAEFSNYGIAVSSKSKYAAEILKLWDYFFSPSGATLVSMGVEGESFNVGADGKITYVGFEDREPSKMELTDKFGINIINVLVASDPRSVNFKLTDRFQEAIDLLRPAAETGKPQPVLKYAEEDNAKLQAIKTDLKKIMEEYAIKVITGKESLDNWDAYVAKLEKAGLKSAQEIQNAAFERYIK